MVQRDHHIHNQRPQRGIGNKRQGQKKQSGSKNARIYQNLRPARAKACFVLQPQCDNANAAKACPVAKQRQQRRPRGKAKQHRANGGVQRVKADKGRKITDRADTSATAMKVLATNAAPMRL